MKAQLPLRLALEARIAEQPAMALEEGDHLPVVPQGTDVVPQPNLELPGGRRRDVGRSRRDEENKGAGTQCQGFQDEPPD